MKRRNQHRAEGGPWLQPLKKMRYLERRTSSFRKSLLRVRADLIDKSSHGGSWCCSALLAAMVGGISSGYVMGAIGRNPTLVIGSVGTAINFAAWAWCRLSFSRRSRSPLDSLSPSLTLGSSISRESFPPSEEAPVSDGRRRSRGFHTSWDRSWRQSAERR